MLPRRIRIALAVIFIVALVLRVAWTLHSATLTPPLSDPQYYHATATNLAEGRGYSVRVDQPASPGAGWGFEAGSGSEATAFWSPGYPFALAVLYKLFGVHQSLAKALNVLAGALTVFPVFYLGTRMRRSRDETRAPDSATGLLAALLAAMTPAYIFWGASLFSEPLFTLGVASTLAVALWAGERRSMAAYFIAGMALVLTAFVRAQGLLFVLPVFVLLAPHVAAADLRAPSRWLRSLALPVARVLAPVLLAVALLVTPWAVRNDVAMGAPSLISDSAGYNLRLAHAPYANGTSTPPRDLWDERPGISFHEREIFWQDAGAHRAMVYAREHPGRELQLAALRIGWLLRSDAEPSIRWSESLGARPLGAERDALVLIGDIFWYGLLALAAASLFVVRRDRMWVACWSAIGVWLVLHLVFAGEPRYHVPLLPVVALLASAALTTGWQRIRSGAASRIRTRRRWEPVE